MIGIGIIYPFEEEKFRKELEQKKQVSIGIQVRELYDRINQLDVMHHYNAQAVLATIKAECMVHLGLMQVREEVDNNVQADDSGEGSQGTDQTQ